MKCSDCPFGLSADFRTDIPSLKAFVFLSIVFPYLIDYMFVVFYLPGKVVRVPIFAGVIQAEIKFHAVFISQSQIHIQ